MKGISISELTQELSHVEEGFLVDPFSSLPHIKQKINSFVKKTFGNSYSKPEDAYEQIPLISYKSFTFDALCKFYYSTNFYSLHRELRDHFETDFSCDLVRKISSSMWRWGLGKGDWNQVVDFYNSVKNFEFIDNSDFEVRLDHTTYYNERGNSKYSRTYLDGVFGVLVYYKSKHVMTIGFSLVEGRKILIQQIQLTNKKGNRFLYKLPSNRVEFVVELFRKNFQDFDIYLVEGNSTIDKILDQYKNQFNRLMQFIDDPKKLDDYDRERYLFLKEQIECLEIDKCRLVSFYGNIGKFKFSNDELKLNSLVHYKIVA